MRFDITQFLNSPYSKDVLFEKKIKQYDNCFVAWVSSYDSASNTVNVQPAIQSEIMTSQNTMELKNKPFILNCHIISNTLNRDPQVGDKALVMVLDEKSNNFFDATYNPEISIEKQTIVNTSKAYKTLSNCVAFIIPTENNPVNGILDKVYPIGSIYISVSKTNPSTLFGGEWEAFSQGRILMGIGNNGETNYTQAEQTGGSENSVALHTHSQNSHTHSFNNASLIFPAYGEGTPIFPSSSVVNATLSTVSPGSVNNNFWSIGHDNRNRQRVSFTQSVNASTATNQNAGVNKGNLPPYITCYMWKRVA